jgi:hypothetical protein
MKAMRSFQRSHLLLPVFSVVLVLSSKAIAQVQQPDEATVIRGIDAAIKARFDSVLSFTDVEHYAVYRNGDETHPAAEMTVKIAYNKDSGKSYTVVSETGSEILRHFVFDSLLEDEKRVNEPANREASWFISANYEMKLHPGGIQHVDGRDCLVISINPRQKAANLIQGTMWVDAKDFSTVKIEGVSTKSPSMLTGPSHVMRQYAMVDGFAQAMHARAESDSSLFGKTIVTIEYRDYQFTLRAAK